MKSRLIDIYRKTILDNPIATLLLIALCAGFCSYFINQFRLDASADSLVLENDQALKYYRSIKDIYGSDDYLVITYSPKLDIFSDESLSNLQRLHDKLSEVERVESVTSILNVPLINSPTVPIEKLKEGTRTLTNPQTDKSLARKELTQSILYKNLLMSEDAKTTAILVTLARDKEREALLNTRNNLREKVLNGSTSSETKKALDKAEKDFNKYHDKFLEKQQAVISKVKHILGEHRKEADLYLGGVPMITADSISFIQKDIKTFGLVVLSLFILILWVVFKDKRWVSLPLITCFTTTLMMVGILGLIGWPVTVVSSNFVALLLIITLSLTVHLIVRYREILSLNPTMSTREIVENVISQMTKPCLYTALTTIVAFGSLVVSGIRPVIDFGWMMATGTMLAFIIAFSLFPAILLLLRPAKVRKQNTLTAEITTSLANMTQKAPKITLGIFAVLILWGLVGLSKLTVENRFIDYYKSTTDIYQGMQVIDKQLGGTTPLEVIIDAPKREAAEEEDDLFGDDLYADEANEETLAISKGHWFSASRFEEIAAVHTFLDSLNETGKVLSLHTTVELLKDMDNGQTTDPIYQTVLLGALYKNISEEVRHTLFSPYISDDGNQLRFSLRVFESSHFLKRQVLIDKITDHLVNELGFAKEQVNVTGMLVLYNNMLQSLFQSQILTISFVFIAIFMMFVVSFCNMKMAAVALIPNMFAALFVLAVMGWFKIPLDMMTITIAAICIGIAVDNSIHYVHRFTAEFEKDHQYWPAVKRAHASIGQAMYYTSMTITLGFSVLTFSNFVPTIYFGLLTACAMLIAMIANLTLLPLLIVTVKPIHLDKEESPG